MFWRLPKALWGSVNKDRIVIFRWTIHLRVSKLFTCSVHILKQSTNIHFKLFRVCILYLKRSKSFEMHLAIIMWCNMLTVCFCFWGKGHLKRVSFEFGHNSCAQLQVWASVVYQAVIFNSFIKCQPSWLIILWRKAVRSFAHIVLESKIMLLWPDAFGVAHENKNLIQANSNSYLS